MPLAISIALCWKLVNFTGDWKYFSLPVKFLSVLSLTSISISPDKTTEYISPTIPEVLASL